MKRRRKKKHLTKLVTLPLAHISYWTMTLPTVFFLTASFNTKSHTVTKSHKIIDNIGLFIHEANYWLESWGLKLIWAYWRLKHVSSIDIYFIVIIDVHYEQWINAKYSSSFAFILLFLGWRGEWCFDSMDLKPISFG